MILIVVPTLCFCTFLISLILAHFFGVFMGGVLSLTLGVLLFAFTLWFQYKLDRYEFENRSVGGVVGFKSYWASVWHQEKRRIARGFGVGLLPILLMGSCQIWHGASGGKDQVDSQALVEQVYGDIFGRNVPGAATKRVKTLTH